MALPSLGPRDELRQYIDAAVQEFGSVEGLFELGNQHSSLGTQNEKGTGIGLLLSKEFVQQHQGRIEVESQEGKGSTFKIYLPLTLVREVF